MLKLFLLERDEREICFGSPEGMPREKVNYQEICSEEAGSGHLEILQNFTNAVLKGEDLIAPGREGIRGLTLSNAAYLSSWKEDWVDIPFSEKEFSHWLAERQREEREGNGSRAVRRENLQEDYADRWRVRW